MCLRAGAVLHVIYIYKEEEEEGKKSIEFNIAGNRFKVSKSKIMHLEHIFLVALWKSIRLCLLQTKHNLRQTRYQTATNPTSVPTESPDIQLQATSNIGIQRIFSAVLLKTQ